MVIDEDILEKNDLGTCNPFPGERDKLVDAKRAIINSLACFAYNNMISNHDIANIEKGIDLLVEATVEKTLARLEVEGEKILSEFNKSIDEINASR